MPRFKNRITELRREKNISQRALAEACGLSLLEFQCVEAGITRVHVDIATGIAGMLGDFRLDEVFPEAHEALASMRRAHFKLDAALRSPQTERAKKVHELFLQAGLEFDVRTWTLKAWIRHRKPVRFRISSEEHGRLWNALQTEERDGFVVFNTRDTRVAINMRHLLGWQFLWDLFVVPVETEPEEQLVVHLADERRIVRFGIESDRAELNGEIVAESNVEDDEEATQFQDLLELLEICSTDNETVVSFSDEDGERAFFRARDIAYLEVPLCAVEPALEEVLCDSEDVCEPVMV